MLDRWPHNTEKNPGLFTVTRWPGPGRVTMRWAGTVAFLIVLAIPGPAGAAQPSEGDFGRDDDFAEYVEERATYHGLTVDAYLLALRTQEEEAWIVEEVNAHPDRFGGAYWDWTAPVPGFVVQYVGTAPPQLHPDVREVPVRYSNATLTTILEELDRRTDAVNPRAAGLVSISLDDFANAVNVVATSNTREVLSLVAPYGDAVVVSHRSAPYTPVDCFNRFNCTPFRGGIEIGGSTYQCTYGLNARYFAGKAMITAGHCDIQLDDFWSHHGNPIGASTRNGLLDGREVDVLRALTNTATSPFNRVYSSDGLKSSTIVGTLAASQLFNGQDLRRAGVNTSMNCEVGGSGRAKYWIGADGWLYAAWGRYTTCTAVGGDSGGPIWHTDSQGRRLLVGFTSTKEGYHALQDDALVALGLIEWCTNSLCS